MSEVVVTVPNHLDHLDFLKEWDELRPHKIVVMQDIGPKPEIPEGFDIDIYDHQDVERELGKSAWIIPSQTSACRSFAYYKAWQLQPDYILTLDNDCFPDGSPLVEGHVRALETPRTLDWVNSAPEGVLYRGFPYRIREAAPTYLSHGLWSNVPDLDAPTSLHLPNLRLGRHTSDITIPRHNFFPMCGMNLAWKASLTPALYFGLFGPKYGFDQFDDIWAGVLVKKVLDHLGYAARSGYPSVEHRKQSNVFVNLKKQAPGMAMNEAFWQEVQQIQLTTPDVTSAYEELIRQLPDTIADEPPGYTKKLKRAALLWLDLFK